MPVAVNHPPCAWSTRGILGVVLAATLAACNSFGPDTVRYQQADYASALADAGKRQTLLNVLKLRYGDVPAFVSVSQILAGYSAQGTFSVGTELLSGNSLRLSDDANVGVGGTFTNSPTVTYTPVTGRDFARTFLAPLQPADLFGLMLAGIQPDLVLGLGLHSIGGFDNERVAPGLHHAAAPGFAEVLRLLLELQRSGRLTVRLAFQDQQRDRLAQARWSPQRGRARPGAALARAARAARGHGRVRGRLHAGPGQTGPDRDPHPFAGGGAGPACGRYRGAGRRCQRRPDLRRAAGRHGDALPKARGAARAAGAARCLHHRALRRRLVLDRQYRPRDQTRVQLSSCCCSR